MAQGKVSEFPAVSVSDEKAKCTIFLKVPGMKTKRATPMSKRKPVNVELVSDINDEAVCISAKVTSSDDSTETYQYKRNMPDPITVAKSKVEVEETQLKLLVTKASPKLWSQFTNYLHCME